MPSLPLGAIGGVDQPQGVLDPRAFLGGFPARRGCLADAVAAALQPHTVERAWHSQGFGLDAGAAREAVGGWRAGWVIGPPNPLGSMSLLRGSFRGFSPAPEQAHAAPQQAAAPHAALRMSSSASHHAGNALPWPCKDVAAVVPPQPFNPNTRALRPSVLLPQAAHLRRAGLGVRALQLLKARACSAMFRQ